MAEFHSRVPRTLLFCCGPQAKRPVPISFVIENPGLDGCTLAGLKTNFMSSAPVQLNRRIQYLDILRGIAISGVLFAFAFWNLGTEPKDSWTRFDKILDEVGAFLIDSKCYTTLACLFAIGFVLHMDKT